MSNSPQTLQVGPNDSGQRIDNYLFKKFKSVPKSLIYRLLRKGVIRVNKKRSKPEYKVVTNDEIKVPVFEEQPRMEMTELPPEKFAKILTYILYEDEELIILNKPAGLAVHAGTGQALGVIEMMRLARPEASYIELAHRLDKETSGCLLLAKTRQALLTLHRLFKEGKIHKSYLAVVHGHWPKQLRHFSSHLQRGSLGASGRGVLVAAEGKLSETSFEVQQYFPDATLLKVILHTGRMHQIRVHTAHHHFPIMGDQKYGNWDQDKAKKNLKIKRLCLHAERVEFEWPETGQKISLKANLPDDFLKLIESLKAS